MADAAGEQEDTTLNSIKEYYRHHVARRVLRQIFYLPIFLSTIDPMSVYKATTYRRREAARFQIHQTSSLRIELNNSDKRRLRWRQFFRLLISYLCLKFSAILIVQVALHANRLDHALDNDANAIALGDWELMVDQQGPLVYWAKLLGNPLIDLPGVTVFVYGLVVAFLSYTSLYLVHYYTIEPFDSAILRNWLEPEREFKRIDLSILQTLQDFSLPLQRTCLCTTGGLRRKYSVIGSDYALLESREIQTQLMKLYRSRYWYFRPYNYTLQWSKLFNQLAIYMSILVVLAIITLGIGCLTPIFAFLFYNPTSQHLEWTRITSCQRITFIEIWISLFFLLPICVFMVIVFACLGLAHLVLLQEVRKDLLACLMELRQMNCGHLKPLDHLETISTTLRPLIIVCLSLNELRSNVRFLTEMVSISVIVSGSSCTCILLADYLDGHNLVEFRQFIIGFHWFWANVVLIASAYIYTRASKLDTITWSLVSELRTRASRDQISTFYEYQVADYWRRLIMSSCFSDSRMSVRPFGLTLTYDRALQLNFLAISFASLLRSF